MTWLYGSKCDVFLDYVLGMAYEAWSSMVDRLRRNALLTSLEFSEARDLFRQAEADRVTR